MSVFKHLMNEWRNSIVNVLEFRYLPLSHPISFGDSFVTSPSVPIMQCTAGSQGGPLIFPANGPGRCLSKWKLNTHNAHLVTFIHYIFTYTVKTIWYNMPLDYFMRLQVCFKFGLQIRLYNLKHLHFLRNIGRFFIRIGSILGLVKGGRHYKRKLQYFSK